MMRLSGIVLAAVLGGAAWLGCSVTQETDGVSNPYALVEMDTRALYPKVDALYTGDQGIYRGCGPNNGVCHNSREFPNLATVGSLVENIGLDCNQKREDPTTLDDLCERKGDFLRSGNAAGDEIAWVEADATTPRKYKMKLRDPLEGSGNWNIVRVTETNGQANTIPMFSFGEFGVTLMRDPNDARSVTITVPAVESQDPEEASEVDVIDPLFAKAGVPGNPLAIAVGDANHNGTFGAALGGKLILPGDPSKSYLFKRLVDPSAGPLMPRANCCFWTKKSLRAIWCWVAGLKEDGANALEDIDYDACPAGPPDTVTYPEPGPTCETSGMCPVQPKAPSSNEPTFTNVYASVLEANCKGCHAGSGSPGHLDFSAKDKAYASLFRAPAHVVASDPAASLLFQRISPELCGDNCMPRGQAALEPALVKLVEAWITRGGGDD